MRGLLIRVGSPVAALPVDQVLRAGDRPTYALDELPPLSDKIAIDELNVVIDREKATQYGIDRAPAIALMTCDGDGADHDSRIRFLGAPSGYEFISLVQAVLLVGGGRESSLTAESRAQLAALDRPLTLQVFTTPT